MSDGPAHHTQRWTHHFEQIDFEIGPLAKICQAQLLRRHRAGAAP